MGQRHSRRQQRPRRGRCRACWGHRQPFPGTLSAHVPLRGLGNGHCAEEGDRLGRSSIVRGHNDNAVRLVLVLHVAQCADVLDAYIGVAVLLRGARLARLVVLVIAPAHEVASEAAITSSAPALQTGERVHPAASLGRRGDAV